jgi:hypothetical protein
MVGPRFHGRAHLGLVVVMVVNRASAALARWLLRWVEDKLRRHHRMIFFPEIRYSGKDDARFYRFLQKEIASDAASAVSMLSFTNKSSVVRMVRTKIARASFPVSPSGRHIVPLNLSSNIAPCTKPVM